MLANPFAHPLPASRVQETRTPADAGARAAVRLKLTPAGRRLLATAPRRTLRVRVVVDTVDLAGKRKQISWARSLRGR